MPKWQHFCLSWRDGCSSSELAAAQMFIAVISGIMIIERLIETRKNLDVAYASCCLLLILKSYSVKPTFCAFPFIVSHAIFRSAL